MYGLYNSLITNLFQAGAATQVLEGEHSSPEELPAVHDVFSLYSGDALGLQLAGVKVEYFVDGLELVCVLSTVSSDLFAEGLGSEALGDLQVEAWRREDRAHHPHPHFRGLKLEARLGLSCETPLSHRQ